MAAEAREIFAVVSMPQATLTEPQMTVPAAPHHCQAHPKQVPLMSIRDLVTLAGSTAARAASACAAAAVAAAAAAAAVGEEVGEEVVAAVATAVAARAMAAATMVAAGGEPAVRLVEKVAELVVTLEELTSAVVEQATLGGGLALPTAPRAASKEASLAAVGRRATRVQSAADY